MRVRIKFAVRLSGCVFREIERALAPCKSAFECIIIGFCAAMMTLIYVLFSIVCVFLIVTVLLQPGKAGGLGAAFGGGGNTVFGASGGTPVFRRITTGCAICFMLLSLLLAYLSLDTSVTSQSNEKRRGLDFGSIETEAAEIPATAPAVEAPAVEIPAAAPAVEAPAVEIPAAAPAVEAPAVEIPAAAPAVEAPATAEIPAAAPAVEAPAAAEIPAAVPAVKAPAAAEPVAEAPVAQ